MNQLTPKRLLLAFQHLIAMFGATVLVPILTGLDISVALTCAGIGTLVFHLCTKGKVPVFLGSSFAFIPVIISVIDKYGDKAYAQGGIMVAGLLYVILSLLVKTIGVEKITQFFPAQVVGPMIMVIGLNLLPTAYGMAKMNLLVAGTTLAIAVGINRLGKGFVKQLAIIIAVTAGYILSYFVNILDFTMVVNAPWFSIPAFTAPKFDLGAIFMIAPVVLAVFMEHVGDITTNGAVVGQNFIKDPGLNRTLLGDGLATIIAGCLGGPANTTYGENTGVLAITKNYDPSIIRITAVFAICLGVIGKVGGVLQSIPVPVMGGISLMLFTMIAYIGVRNIQDNKVEWNVKNSIVMGSILILGLGAPLLANYGVNLAIPITADIKITGLSLAAIVGIILNKVLNR